MSSVAAPPSPQEIHRKLSVHSMAGKSPRPPPMAATVSGNESDSDASILNSDSTVTMAGAGGSGIAYAAPSVQVQPLSSIAERRSGSGGEDSEDEDADEEEGGWKTSAVRHPQGGADESVIKAGYLWKKGERRKTWKKRWFVLRPAHLAYYKTAAEYQLLRLLDLADVHSCTKVALKRHENTFGLVSPIRTFYLQAKNPGEVHDWVKAIDEARQALQAVSSGSASNPIPIPRGRLRSNAPPPVTPSPPSHGYYMTSSDSEDNASPSGTRSYSLSSQTRPTVNVGGTSPSAKTHAIDPAKMILSGYLMKCGSKRRNWRKRWFVLSGEQLVYFGSHMDTKPHRRFPFAEILDALEYDLPANRQNPALMVSPTAAGGPPVPPGSEDDATAAHTFKIVTTKRTLLLCAPSEEDEIKWLGAVRALIARRSGSGGVPGDSTKIAANDISPTPSGMSPGGSGLITRVRRPSASGSAGLPAEGSSQ
ncbi:Pleckstrin y domain-containing family A member 1 [Mycena venus]|uniref:Pleckstrin y domain-containing family A member 1 n=1 Tax=Mycena venus TaxID=2733690 RepID=A0A8H6X984_9AGAR|nr:Pleckstrin y domain-containing family A member 1 [Mycena venus]